MKRDDLVGLPARKLTNKVENPRAGWAYGLGVRYGTLLESWSIVISLVYVCVICALFFSIYMRGHHLCCAPLSAVVLCLRVFA